MHDTGVEAEAPVDGEQFAGALEVLQVGKLVFPALLQQIHALLQRALLLLRCALVGLGMPLYVPVLQAVQPVPPAAINLAANVSAMLISSVI